MRVLVSGEHILETLQEYCGKTEKLTVSIRKGVFYMEKPIVIDDSLLKGTKLTLEAEEEGQACLTGSKRFIGEWRPYREGIFYMKLETGLEFDQLFVNDNPCILARYPNYKENEILNGYSEDAIRPERVKGWKHPETGYIRAIHGYEWGGNDYRITGSDKEGNLIYEWVGDNARGCSMHKERRMVENIFEELDAPEEWFYDRESGILYYMPDNSEVRSVDAMVEWLSSVIIEGTFLDEILKFVDCSSSITVKGLRFEKTHRTLFQSRFEGLLRSDWTFVRKAVVSMENCENVRIEDCKFRFLGGNAVLISGYNRNHTVRRCDFTDLGASGILVVGYEKAVRTPSYWGRQDGTEKENVNTGLHRTVMEDELVGPATEDYPHNICLKENYFYNTGIFEKQSAGIYVSVSHRVRIMDSTFHHMPRSAITIGDGCFGGHVISGCDMFDTVRETGDHGPFNSWGRDRFWSLGGYSGSYDKGKLKRPYAFHDAMEPTLIEHNRITGHSGFGFDLDDGSSNYIIRNNLCLGIGIKCREGFDRMVVNNMLVGAPLDIHCQFALNHDSYVSNVIVNSIPVRKCGGADEECTTFYSKNCYKAGEKWLIYQDEQEAEEIAIAPQFRNEAQNDYTIMNQEFCAVSGFCNFPMGQNDFGRKGAPRPEPFTSQKEKQIVFKFRGALLSTVGEGERSACAAPDLCGLYILNYSQDSFLDRVRMVENGEEKKINLTGKIIRSINGQILTYENYQDMAEHLEKGEFSLTLYSGGMEQNYKYKA